MISLFPDGKKTKLTDLYGKTCENEAYFEIKAIDSYLYAAFYCFFKEKPKDMTAIHGKKVYRDECVELFIGNREKYYEIDVSAYNARFTALVQNPNNEPEPPEKEIEIAGLETSVEMQANYYEVVYKIPLDSLKAFGQLYFNAFRVEMVNGQRVSRAVSKTMCKSHHCSAAFLPVAFCDK